MNAHCLKNNYMRRTLTTTIPAHTHGWFRNKRRQSPMKLRGCFITFLTLSCSLALAEDAYYHVPLSSLTLLEGKLPKDFQQSGSYWQMGEALLPYAVLDGDGEAFVSSERPRRGRFTEVIRHNAPLVLRSPKGNPLTGRLFVLNADLNGMVALKFKVDAASEKNDSKQEFFIAKENYYRYLRERNIPGGAWFRHQETEAANARGTKAPTGISNSAVNPRQNSHWDNDYDSTYDLFSGGRALSENLQL